jgi:hypothetical protein
MEVKHKKPQTTKHQILKEENTTNRSLFMGSKYLLMLMKTETKLTLYNKNFIKFVQAVKIHSPTHMMYLLKHMKFNIQTKKFLTANC